MIVVAQHTVHTIVASTMPIPGVTSEDAELKDLTRLLQSYRDEDGSINPDRAPPDMKALSHNMAQYMACTRPHICINTQQLLPLVQDLLQRLQDEQHKAQAGRASTGITIVPEPW